MLNLSKKVKILDLLNSDMSLAEAQWCLGEIFKYLR
jgi:hypothetical protein